MKHALTLTAWVATGLLGLSGCHTNCNNRSPCDNGAPRAPWPAGDVPRAPFPPGSPAPPPGSQMIPPPPAPAPFAPQSGNYGAPPPHSLAQGWQPSNSVAIRLGPPQIIEDRSRETTRFYGPRHQTAEPPVGLPAANAKKPDVPATLPVGIPQFAVAKEGVACGLRPLLDDGLDWLETNRYRAVLHLRLPGEDDSADRKQVEKRGLKYSTLEVSPQTVTQTVVDEFNRIVADSANQPLFIYDRDSALAGALWYAHFRTADNSAEEAARVRAGSLGLREDREGSHRAMWLAVQQYVNQGK
jgi:protein tyrosine phosphatase (PTP) superfamily phosphohydrolase (DUF442 family)